MTEPDADTRLLESRDKSAWYHIGSEAGYTPHIGSLVGMMTYARLTTLRAVRGLSVEELDATPTGFSNSIGMLLAHIAATGRLYQRLSFEARGFDEQEMRLYGGAMTFGARGERVRGRSLEELLTQLAEVRAVTLAELARRDDAWLASMVPNSDMNQYWAWFHVMEDELSHRGQMRVLRKALEASAVG